MTRWFLFLLWFFKLLVSTITLSFQIIKRARQEHLFAQYAARSPGRDLVLADLKETLQVWLVFCCWTSLQAWTLTSITRSFVFIHIQSHAIERLIRSIWKASFLVRRTKIRRRCTEKKQSAFKTCSQIRHRSSPLPLPLLLRTFSATCSIAALAATFAATRSSLACRAGGRRRFIWIWNASTYACFSQVAAASASLSEPCEVGPVHSITAGGAAGRSHARERVPAGDRRLHRAHPRERLRVQSAFRLHLLRHCALRVRRRPPLRETGARSGRRSEACGWRRRCAYREHTSLFDVCHAHVSAACNNVND